MAQLAGHGAGDGEVEGAVVGEAALVERGEVDEGVVAAAGRGEDGPGVVVPVDEEFGVAEARDEAGDGEGGNGGGVLDEDPLRRGEGVGEVAEEVVGLEEDFVRGEEEEGEEGGFGGWGGEGGDGDIGVVDEVGVGGGFWGGG